MRSFEQLIINFSIFVNALFLNFQNVCFFAVSDDIKNATKLLQNEVNKKYKVSFPGEGEASDPGIGP